jgi:hypothetical protein
MGVVSFTPLRLYLQENSPQYPLHRRLGGPQIGSGIKPQLLSLSAHILIAVPNELSQLHYCYILRENSTPWSFSSLYEYLKQGYSVWIMALHTHQDGLQPSLGLEVLRELIRDFSHQLLIRFALFRFLTEYSCEAFEDVIPSMVVIGVSCVSHYQLTQFQILVSSLEQWTKWQRNHTYHAFLIKCDSASNMLLLTAVDNYKVWVYI